MGMIGVGNPGRIHFCFKKKIHVESFKSCSSCCYAVKKKKNQQKSIFDLGLFSLFCHCGNDTDARLSQYYFKIILK